MSSSDRPIKRADGRYDNVDFRKAVGHRLRPLKCTYNRRDVLLFANAIGAQADEKHFLYELHPCFAAFPTFPINLAFKQTDQDVFDFIARTTLEPIPGTPPFDAQRSVDGERGIEIVNTVPTCSEGLDLEIQGQILGVYDKGGAMVSEQEQTLVDVKTGKIYARMTSTSFGMGQGGYGGPRGPIKPANTLPDRPADAVHRFRTTPETALLYRLCGDYNPMHADDDFGRRAGFKGAILQGLCTWNIAAHGLLRAVAGSDPTRFKAFGARFKSIVYPGDELETQIWKAGSDGHVESYSFETVIRGEGRAALSNGYALIKLQPSKL
ncbi:Thioesterase/thiol ester dehydrase-isomerase [Poronia punctata]|nr:Thioesterase/thiol ester dehydrase-isomerase [Poronia punctata]